MASTLHNMIWLQSTYYVLCSHITAAIAAMDSCFILVTTLQHGMSPCQTLLFNIDQVHYKRPRMTVFMARNNKFKLMNYTLFGPHFGGSPSTSFQLFDSSDSCPSLCCDELPLDRLFSSDICPRFRLVATGLPADEGCFRAISSISSDCLGGRFSFPWLLWSSSIASCGCLNPVK